MKWTSTHCLHEEHWKCFLYNCACSCGHKKVKPIIEYLLPDNVVVISLEE